MMVPRIEMVRWTDSGMHIAEGWAPTEVYRSSAQKWHGLVITVGMVLHEDDEVLVLGLSYDPEHEHWFGAQLIHKPSILDRKVLN